LEATDITVDTIIINDHYMLMVAIALLFLVIAIGRWIQKGEGSLLLDVLVWVSWFTVGAMHLLASPTSTPFYSISLFFWGIGLIFFVLTWVDVFQLFNTKKSGKGVGPL